METLIGLQERRLDVIYQVADKDFNFFESHVRELDAERNQCIITSIFRTLTGTRHTTNRRQVTSIPPGTDNSGCRSPTVIPSMAANPGMPVTNTNPGQEASDNSP